MEQDSIFRKKSIERISSPDQLNDYIKVSNPGIWIILAAVIILLAGLCIWGIFGTMDSTIEACIVNTDGETYCCISKDDFTYCAEGMKVTVGETEGKLKKLPNSETVVTEELAKLAEGAVKLPIDDVVYCVPVDITLPVGVYRAEVLVESISPMTYVFN